MRLFTGFAAGVLALFLVAGTASAADNTAYGKIKTVAGDKNQFVLMDASSGKEQLFTVTEGSSFMRGGRDAKLGDLKAGDHVIVVYATINDGMYAMDVIHRDKQAGKQMTGTLVAVQTGNKFVVNADGKEVLFTLTDNGQVSTESKWWDSLSSIKQGTKIRVNYVQLQDGGVYATCVDSTPGTSVREDEKRENKENK